MHRQSFCALSLLQLAACSAASVDERSTPDALEHTSALVSATSVLGFENSAAWSITQGTISSSTDRSEGERSVLVTNGSTATLTSVALGTLSGVTSSLGLDVKPSAPLGHGSIELSLSIPSRGLDVSLGSASFAGLPNAQFQTLPFNIPASAATTLRSSYSDLRFRIRLTGPSSAQVRLDGLRFLGGVPADKIEIEVSGGADPRGLDDFVYASVDGLRRKAWPAGAPDQNTRIDVSSWFGAGTHELRVQALNTGGQFRYGVRVWKNGNIVLDAQCPSTLCDGQGKSQGILFDQSVQLSTPNRPLSGVLTLTSAWAGKLYIDNAFTGLTVPASFVPGYVPLPQGAYTLGLGTASDVSPN